MELDMQTIGNRIKERRKELNLTQLDIKAKVGISSGNISDIERGNRLPAASTLVQLAEALECSVDYILTGDSPIKEKFELSVIGKTAHELLDLFYILSSEDQDELLMIAQMKANKRKRQGNAKSSPTENDDMSSETA